MDSPPHPSVAGVFLQKLPELIEEDVSRSFTLKEIHSRVCVCLSKPSGTGMVPVSLRLRGRTKTSKPTVDLSLLLSSSFRI